MHNLASKLHVEARLLKLEILIVAARHALAELDSPMSTRATRRVIADHLRNALVPFEGEPR